MESSAEKAKGEVRLNHLPWLDSLRAFAALWVLADHAYFTVGFAPTNLALGAIKRFLTHGHFSVTAFIAISGFSLARSPSVNDWRLKGGYREFLVSRWVRIIPPYYVALAISLVLALTILSQRTGTDWDSSVPVTGTSVVGHLLLIQNFFGSPRINRVFWSISLEFQIYIFFGIVLWAMRKGSYAATLALCVAFATIAAGIHVALEGLVLKGLATDDEFALTAYFVVFGLGVCACGVSRSTGKIERGRSTLLGLVSLVLMGVGLSIYGHIVGDVLFGFGFSLLLVLFSSNDRLARSLSAKPLAAVGAMAYSIYLIHAPVVQLVYQTFGIWKPHDTLVHSAIFFVVATAFSLAASWAFYISCERPFAKVRHFLRARKAARG